MSFGGRWIPMHVMNSIFLLWVIAALIVAGLLYWFMRSKPPVEPDRGMHCITGFPKKDTCVKKVICQKKMQITKL